MVGKLGRSIAVGGLLFVLVVSLGMATVTIGAERTVLNGDFVADSLESEDAYAVAVEEITSQLEDEAGTTPTEPGQPAIDDLFPRVLTASYLQNQTEANIDRAYAYLHGDRDDIYLAINTTPLKDRMADELVAQLLSEQSLSNFDQRLGSMATNQSAYQAAREEFKDEQLARIQAETDRELSDAELQRVYDEQREEIRTRLIEQMESEVAGSDQPAELEPVLVELGTLRINALMDPDMTYEQFTTELAETREDLEATVRDLVRTQLDEELPDEMELSEQLGPQEREQLEQLRGVVGILDMLVYVLPLVVLLVALLIGWVTVARSSAFLAVGSGTAVLGVISALGFMGVGSRAETEIASMAGGGNVPPAMTELVAALVSRTVSVFTTQSWLIALLGVVLIALGIAIRRELVPIEDTPSETDESSADHEHGSANDSTDGETDATVTPGHEDLEQKAPVEEPEDTASETDQDDSR